MKKSNSPPINIGSIFGQFHMLFIFIVIVAGLIYVILSLGDVITDAQNGSNAVAPAADSLTSSQNTIDAINKLHASSQSGAPALPGGRLNPFGE